MIKARKKWLSILLTLTFLLSIVLPLGGVANAATTNSALTVPNIATGTAKTLGTLQIMESTPGSIAADQVFTLTLLNNANLASGVSWNVYDATDNPDFDPATSIGAFVYAPGAVGDDTNTITDLYLDSQSDNSVTVKVNAVDATKKKAILRVYFKSAIDVPNSGDISVNILAPSTGFSEGDVVVARAVSAGTTASAISTKTVGSGSNRVLGILRIVENCVGALQTTTGSPPTSNTIKITAPVGFKITGVDGTVTSSGFSDPVGFYCSGTDRYGYITIAGQSTSYPGMIQFAPVVTIDSSEATMGDITFNIGGTNSGITSADVKLGTYGDYGCTVTADTPKEILAAKETDQKVATITLKEALAGSLIADRTLKLTLNGDAKWVEYPTPNYAEGTSGFLSSGSLSTDGKTIEYTINNQTTSAAKVEFKNFTVKTSAAMSGDLKVTVGGTAGASGEVTVATVKPPVTAAAASTPDVIIGQQDQAAGDFTITEAKAEAIKDATGSDSVDLKVVAPTGVEFAVTPTVTVTDGDIQIDTVSKSGGTVSIELKSTSSKPSTIKFSNVKLTVDRTVPVGPVQLKIQGDGVNETTSDWPDATTVAKVTVANCVTPAPAEQKVVTKLTIGSTTMKVNDQDVTMDAAPYIKDGRTMISVRWVAKALGISDENIIWDGANKTVTVMTGSRVVQMKIGSKVMTVNGASITMDAAAEIVPPGRTCIPMRFLAQALGAKVTWDDTTKTAIFEL